MFQHTDRTTRRGPVRGLRPAVGLAAVALSFAAIAPVVSGAATKAAGTSRAPHGVVIMAVSETFGPQLVVGSGPLKGFTLYAITSDVGRSFGCTMAIVHLPGAAFSCTGPLSDNNDEWPALTTSAAPVAGHGVTQGLLGTVYRPGIGHQVTYNGHPLYLFDNGPGQITGVGWDEPSLPPFHGVWWLVSPTGAFQPWAGTLSVSVLADGTTSTLSAIMNTGAGFHPFPVYSFSADTSSLSACVALCAKLYPPLLTSGTPGISGPGVSGAIGSITRADGTQQVTYNGHPLYLFGGEKIAKVPGRGFVASGNGANKAVGGGTFTMVTP